MDVVLWYAVEVSTSFVDFTSTSASSSTIHIKLEMPITDCKPETGEDNMENNKKRTRRVDITNPDQLAFTKIIHFLPLPFVPLGR